MPDQRSPHRGLPAGNDASGQGPSEASARIEWQHAKPDLTHPCEPRYGADGKWVCYVCRTPVNDGGRAVDMRAIQSAPLKADPDALGLHVEGS